MRRRRKARPSFRRMEPPHHVGPKPSGYRFYHTHVRAGANLSAGHYTGLVGPVYIEPKNNPGNYDRENFSHPEGFGPTLSRGGDMDMNFLSPAATVKDLKRFRRERDECLRSPKARRMDSRSATIPSPSTDACWQRRTDTSETGRTRAVPHLERKRHRDPQSGVARPLFLRSCAGWQPHPQARGRSGLWLGTAERVSAIVEMNHPGIWIMGDMATTTGCTAWAS